MWMKVDNSLTLYEKNESGLRIDDWLPLSYQYTYDISM